MFGGISSFKMVDQACCYFPSSPDFHLLKWQEEQKGINSSKMGGVTKFRCGGPWSSIDGWMLWASRLEHMQELPWWWPRQPWRGAGAGELAGGDRLQSGCVIWQLLDSYSKEAEQLVLEEGLGSSWETDIHRRAQEPRLLCLSLPKPLKGREVAPCVCRVPGQASHSGVRLAGEVT